MACTYDLSKLSEKERELVETGERRMCDYCEHSMFVDRIDKNNEVEEFVFVKCLSTDIEYRPLKCSVFDHYKRDELSG
jgi:hypothetical protein